MKKRDDRNQYDRIEALIRPGVSIMITDGQSKQEMMAKIPELADCFREENREYARKALETLIPKMSKEWGLVNDTDRFNSKDNP